MIKGIAMWKAMDDCVKYRLVGKQRPNATVSIARPKAMPKKEEAKKMNEKDK